MPERARQLMRDIRFIARDFRMTNADIEAVFGFDLRNIESLPDDQVVGSIHLLTACRETLQHVVRSWERTRIDDPEAALNMLKGLSI